jgi:hypothetical protein
MSRIILDHIKRWWLVWLIIGIFNGIMVGAIVKNGAMFKGFGAVMFPLIMWAGAMQLNFDLQRGIGRTIATLPVTTRQIGRAWWFFSVAIPTILLAATTCLGLMIYSAWFNEAFQLRTFLVTASANALFLGGIFALFVGEIQGFPQTAFGWLRRIVGTVFMMTMMFVQLSFSQPAGIVVLLVGLVLAVVGWFRAEAMVVQRATFRPGIQIGKRKRGQYRAASGFGGLPFLCQTLFIRVGYMGIGVVVWLLLTQMLLHGTMKMSPKELLHAVLPTFGSFGYFFMFIFLLLPMLVQLRHLRSLPISRTALAALLVLLPVLPVLAVGLMWSVFSGAFANDGNGFQIPTAILVSAAMTAISTSVFVWQGLRMGTYLLLLFIMIFATSGSLIFSSAKIPAALVALVALGLIVLSFFITRRLLRSSSRAYRPLPAMMNGLAGYGGGR